MILQDNKMDEQDKRKVVEGLIVLIEDILDTANKVILEKNFEDAKYNLKVIKKFVELVYIAYGKKLISWDDYWELDSCYKNLIKKTDEVFVEQKEGYERQNNLKELIKVIE